ncbi:oxidoreductase [Methylobacterium terrae]|uniref:Oxidoreductase n=1 Tax=Methylobacterium terrae TaxID=2202827 RepID=A0A2U8WKN9_9HYPH|nr:Gfo/Idh/MocA family oxidoreductase [Methylobacterium terrae]AWN46814.1 oxidoreductase [Methylobacterium terrae]
MIRIGVIGYGYFGPNIARCVAEANGTALAAIADPSPAAQARAASRHPGVTIDESWHRMLADPEIDAVAIATPTRLHYEIALAALMAGKHVLVEKPITPTSREAARLVAEAAKRRLTLMVDHTFVYTGAVQKIRELIDTGVTGDLFYYDSTRINFGLFQDDVNVIWDLAVHDLAILDYLLPAETLAISATGAGHIKGSPENMAHITLYLEGGVTAHLNVNWLAPVKIRRTLIGGSRRMIVFDDMEPSEKVKVYDRGVEFDERPSPEEIRRILPAYRMGDVWTPHIPVKEALVTEIEHFARCITRGEVPLSSGESGLRVVRLLEAASQSLAQRGHPIDLSPLRAA